MCEELIKNSKKFAECVASEINKLSKGNYDFPRIITVDKNSKSELIASTYEDDEGNNIISINPDYFSEKSQEDLDFDLKSTIAHEMLHIYLKNIKNVSLEEVLVFYPECLQFIGKKIYEGVLENFIHHLFIPKLIDVLGYDNGIFFDEIKKIDKAFNKLENYISLSLDFWFNDKIQNKNIDDYILKNENHIDVFIFNKCCEFLEIFPFDDIDFNCDFSDKKFFEPLAILFDDIYQYAKNV